MEAIGFGQAVLLHNNVHALNIRGISDLLDGKSVSDRGGSQEIASERAAAFAMELLFQLDCTQFSVLQSSLQDSDKKEASYKNVGIAQVGDNSTVKMKGEYVSARDMIIKK